MDKTLKDLEDRKNMLLTRKKEIDIEINRLESLITRHKINLKAGALGEKITNKTQGKIMVRTFILDAIQTNGPISSVKLYELATLYMKKYNESTFRSHIHRMKNDGYIQKDKNGLWHIVHPAYQAVTKNPIR